MAVQSLASALLSGLSSSAAEKRLLRQEYQLIDFARRGKPREHQRALSHPEIVPTGPATFRG